VEKLSFVFFVLDFMLSPCALHG